jgi:hypothetical protein
MFRFTRKPSSRSQNQYLAKTQTWFNVDTDDVTDVVSVKVACRHNTDNVMYSHCCLLCILIVVYVFLDAATLTEVFPRFFLGCKANARA